MRDKLFTLLFIVLVLFPTNPMFPQLQKFNLHDREYHYDNGKWFTFFEGKLGDEIIPNRVIVKMKNNGYLENIDFSTLSMKEISLASSRLLDGFYVLQINDKASAFELVTKLNQILDFEVIEFDVIGERHDVPNDPLYNQQWNLARINLPEAWNLTTGSSSIILGIIDSGVKYNHIDLDGNIWVNPAEDINGNGLPDFFNYSLGGDIDGLDNDGNNFIDDLIGWDFAGGGNNPPQPYIPDNNPEDYTGHGTNVSGIISAQTNNLEGGYYQGISGIAGGWGTNKGVSLMVLRDGGYNPILSFTAAAIEYAARNGAKIINISSSTILNYSILEAAINYAVNTYDVVIVASSGNYYPNEPTNVRYPAKYTNTIAVGATDYYDIRTSISCYGPELDVVAPTGVYSTNTQNNYSITSEGTSFSAPHVAGLAALIRSVNPNLNSAQVRSTISFTADDKGPSGRDDFYGYGLVNASNAVHKILVPQVFPSVTAALTAAVSGQTVYVEAGSYSITSDMTIKSGVKLNLVQGTTLTFSSGKKLLVQGGGILSANGTTFRGNGTRGSWNSISFYANSSGTIENSTITDAQCGIYSSGASVTINNNTITNNSLYGLSLISNSYTPINNCIISNNGTGINISSSNFNISGSSILNNTNYGINSNNVHSQNFWDNNIIQGNGYAMLLNNSSPWISYSDISSNLHGITITSSNTSFAAPPQVDEEMLGYNRIACNSSSQFKAQNFSYIYAGYGPDGGYNSIYGSELPDMEALNNTEVLAFNNFWGSQYPAIYADFTSKIDTTNLLVDDPNPSCMYKSSSNISDNNLVEDELSKILEEAVLEGRKGNKQRAKELLMYLIERKYNNKYSPLALLNFYRFAINERNDKNVDIHIFDMDNLLTNIYSRVKSDSLRPFAVRLLGREAALSFDFEKMKNFNNEVIENYPNSSFEISSLYDLVMHYKDIENDLIQANTLFEKMVNTYPEDDLTKFAAINLGIDYGIIKKNNPLTEIPKLYYLENAYPNPFNPSTTISYSLPLGGFTTLKVYDMLGNEVATLVNEEKTAGNYLVDFNASNLSSGVYFYTLTSGDFTMNKKMILMK